MFPDAAELESDHVSRRSRREVLARCSEIQCAGVADVINLLSNFAVNGKSDRYRAVVAITFVPLKVCLPPSVAVISTLCRSFNSFPFAGKRRDLVCFKQHRHTAGELFDDLVLASDHLGRNDFRIARGDAMHIEMLESGSRTVF
jgi:hypothetical protein